MKHKITWLHISLNPLETSIALFAYLHTCCNVARAVLVKQVTTITPNLCMPMESVHKKESFFFNVKALEDVLVEFTAVVADYHLGW